MMALASLLEQHACGERREGEEEEEREKTELETGLESRGAVRRGGCLRMLNGRQGLRQHVAVQYHRVYVFGIWR